MISDINSFLPVRTHTRIVSLVVFMGLLSGCSEDVARLNIEGTSLCIPKYYIPGVSGFGQILKRNFEGFDDSAGAVTLRFPADFIQAGVPSYTVSHRRMSPVFQDYFDFEHAISGIAYPISYVGNPGALDGRCSKISENCSQTIIYEGVVYIYELHEIDLPVAPEVKSFLMSKFREWDETCSDNA